MDAFKNIGQSRWKCQRCGFTIKGHESPYRCVKCVTLNAHKMDKEYFEKHNDQALNDSTKT